MSVPVTTEGLSNLEGHAEFDLTWPWRRPGGLRAGTTAVLRVKDEAPSLPFVLPPLLRATDHVLVVDNGSTDGTPEVAAETAARAGLADRLTQASYPFAVARAGAEHLAVHERSVHSLSYFYNWCFAQVGHPLLLEVGRRHGAHRRGRGLDRRPRLAGRQRRGGRADDRAGAAPRALPRQRQPRLPRPRPAQRRGVGLPGRARLRLHQGLRVGDPHDAAPGPLDRAAARAVRGAEVPARRRVRPLDRPGVLRHQLPQQAQAPRVDGLQRAPRRRGARRRARDPRPARHPRRRPRHPRLAAPRPPPPPGRPARGSPLAGEGASSGSSQRQRVPPDYAGLPFTCERAS